MSTKVVKRHIEFDRAVYPKNVRWSHDFDYLRQLDPKEAAWMARFIAEYVNGNVKKGDRKALHKGMVVCKNCSGTGREKLGKTSKKIPCGECKGKKTINLRVDCYRRKNAQNRDLMSILNANGLIDQIDRPRKGHAFSNTGPKAKRRP